MVYKSGYKGSQTLTFLIALFLGVVLSAGVSVWATSIGNSISVSTTLEVTGASTLTGAVTAGGALTVTGATTLNGNSTFGNAATDINLFTGTLQASTTALFTSGITTYGGSTFGDAAADVNLFTGTLQASTTALFTGNSTFYADVLISSGLGVGDTSTTTDGSLQVSGASLFGGIMNLNQSGTSTISVKSSTATRGGCIELEGADGASTFSIYATSSGPAVIQTGGCR